MIKGLFITFEGLPKTIFDSQVLTHISDMRKKNIHMVLWSFATSSKMYFSSMQRLNELQRDLAYDVKLFRAFSTKIPFSSILNACLLLFLLKKNQVQFSFIHARTDYATLVCGLIRAKYNFKLIWDCRGDALAEFLDTEDKAVFNIKLIRSIKEKIIKIRVFFAARLCNKAIFVSDALKKKITNDQFLKPYEIIPCAAPSNIFFFSEELREQIRAKYLISCKNIAIIYSGSLVGSYHIFDECISYIKRLIEKDSSIIFLLVTPHNGLAKGYLTQIPKENYRLISAPFEEVNWYLNAADVGIILRRKNPVNKVASPVKFAEYSLAGLPIIMTDAVEQSLTISKLIGNGIIINIEDEPCNLDMVSVKKRKHLSQKANLLLSRESTISSYMRIYDQINK